ncbi:hypothetical protein M413DRAFT_30597 [Hebeloma cylindrosporum]|uniref:Uncharacterized protein n=1 Tax=Hebeloma cylindrosporum TaxID=76867 RepID=A0A0C3BMN7_HEBCY|nr:hypothetical protein M413DRAFT_30597 [Hebeloma cylindrosporum h7]
MARPSSTNWVIYKDHFLWAIDTRGHLDHIDGSTKELVNPNARCEDKTKDLTASEAAAEIQGKRTVLEIWSSLMDEFEKKSQSMDVRAHFDKLCTMREELASMGAPPEEDVFYTIIMSSMPASYDSYISAINGTASILKKTLTSNELMQMLMEEANHHTMKAKKSQWKEENVAFYGNDSGPS